MKKSTGILSLFVIFILVSSVSLVSASWFGNVWSKITGRAIEENISTEPVPELAPEPGTEENITCTDSDGGLNYNVKGHVSKGEQVQYDVCKGEGGDLIEVFCDGNELKENYYLCPNGCSDGACLSKECPTIIGWRIENGKCIADSGCNYDSSRYAYYDTEEKCVSQLRVLSERETEPKPAEPRPVSPVEETKICATKITINFDKEIYYYGDSVEVVVEIFDSQGNRIPNYAFYSQIYSYQEDVWHTLSGEERTDESGYKIFRGRIEEGKMALGKAKQKVYTKAYSNCGSVENSVEVEVRKGEKEEVCGIGVCVPEEKAKIEEIPKEKMLYSCNGCELEDKCYPISYRKTGEYCSINNEFIAQLEKGSCENSFECKSNVCISDECISESLMKKIINWFKKLFGKEEPESELEPEAEKCSKLLIEKNIGDYKYNESGYGEGKDRQAPLYSEEGKQIGVVKCCGILYDRGMAALVCPFESRGDIENSVKWLSARGEIYLGEYEGEKVYTLTGKKVIIWTNDKYIIAVGTEQGNLLPENIINAYLKKYPNNLAEILEKIATPTETIPAERITEEPVSQPPSRITEEFLDKVKGLGEVTLIDFETLPDGRVLQADEKLTGKEWESLGVVFEAPSEEYLKVFGPWYPFNPLGKVSLSPGFGPFEAGSDTHDDLNIIFNEPVKAAGIYLLDLGGTDERESITFLDKNNNVLEKISPWPKSTFGNPAPGTFVYLIEDGISKIEILENTQDGDDIAYDNLYFVK